jgi:hypothetical protein
MTFEMKQCPFCGGDDQELSLGTTESGETPCAINCRECGALGPVVHVDSGATPLVMLTQAGEEWDRRETRCPGCMGPCGQCENK